MGKRIALIAGTIAALDSPPRYAPVAIRIHTSSGMHFTEMRKEDYRQNIFRLF